MLWCYLDEISYKCSIVGFLFSFFSSFDRNTTVIILFPQLLIICILIMFFDTIGAIGTKLCRNDVCDILYTNSSFLFDLARNMAAIGNSCSTFEKQSTLKVQMICQFPQIMQARSSTKKHLFRFDPAKSMAVMGNSYF